MIGQAESGLGTTPYDTFNNPLTHKTASVKASLYEPEFAQITRPAVAPSEFRTLDVIVYNNRIYRVNGTNLEWMNGGAWTIDTASFAPATLIFGGRVTLSTNGTGLYAIAPTTTGIQHRSKATPGSAWTSWAVATVSGYANTQTRVVDSNRTLSSMTSTIAGETGYLVGAMNDSDTATHYSCIYTGGTPRPVFTWTTSGAFTARSFKMQSADWTRTTTNADKRAAPSSLKLEYSTTGGAPWTLAAISTKQNRITSWPPAQIKTWMLSPTAFSGTVTWRLTVLKPLKPKGGRVQIGNVWIVGQGSETVATWQRIVSPPDTPDLAYAVRYDGTKNAYHICRLNRTGGDFGTFSYATNCGDLTFQYEPYDLDVAKMSPDENGNTIYGILLSTPYPGERQEKYENNALTYENLKDNALLFFTNVHNFAITSMDGFSDPVIIDSSPQISSSVQNVRYLNATGGRLSVLNGRWTVTCADNNDLLLKDVVGAGSAYSSLGLVYQSANGLDWSVGKRLYAMSSDLQKGEEYLQTELILYNNVLYWMSAYAHTSGYNPPVLGGTPTLIDLTTQMEGFSINTGQVTTATIVLTNNNGYFDAPPLAIDRPWLVYIYARLANTGDEMLISRGISTQAMSENVSDRGGEIKRTITLEYQDFMGLLNGPIASEEWVSVDPVQFYSEYSRQSAIEVVSGVWEWTSKVLNSRPIVMLKCTTINGMALYAPSAGCINGRFRVFPNAATVTGEGWIVRWVDSTNAITVRFFLNGGVETIQVRHFVNVALSDGVNAYESTNYALSFTGVKQIDIVTRYGKIYFICQKPSTMHTQVFAHTINNNPQLTLSIKASDSLYKGAFGYINYGTANSYKEDTFTISGRWMTIEKTVRNLAAKSFLFDVQTKNRLPPTSGAWSANGTTTFSVTAHNTNPLKRVDSMDILASTTPDTNNRSLDMTGTDRLLSFTLGSNLYPFYVIIYKDFTVSIIAKYISGYIVIDGTGFGSYGFQTAVIPMTINATSTPHIEIGITNRDENTFDNTDHINIAVYVNNRLIATCAMTFVNSFVDEDGTTIYQYGKTFNPVNNKLALSSTTTTCRMINPHISALSQISDPLTLDPGETPMQAINRVTEGLNLRMQMRHNGTLYLRPSTDYDATSDPIATAKEFEPHELSDTLSFSYNPADIKNHIRVQGAYREGEYADGASIIKVGHRFMLVQNPYIYTVDECKLEAKRLVARSISEADTVSLGTHWLPTLEIGDVIAFEDLGQNAKAYIIEQTGVSFNFISATGQVIYGRKKP